MAAYTTIDDPTLHFQVLTYTGDGESTRALTLPGDTDMAPDLVWIKQRNTTRNHQVNDRVRGTSKVLLADLSDAEDATGGTVKAYGTDGFSVNDSANANEDSGTYVAWCWKANGSGSSNTTGTINTTATSANTTSGFSISTYTGTGSAATIGHGLGAVPDVVIVKGRTIAASWRMYHSANNNTDYMTLSTTDYVVTSGSNWNDTTPTSTVFSLGTDAAINGSYNYLAYAWTSIQGFSKFGGYTGNGNADGPYIHLGFKPAFLICKRKDSGGVNNWKATDHKRDPHNMVRATMNLDSNGAEGAEDHVDFLANGFKIRRDGNDINNNGGTYIYLAWAEAPFVNSNGVPCNAR